MPCYICDQPMDEPRLDPRDMKLAPCSTCEGVIQDCLDTYPKALDDPDNEDYVAYLETTVFDFEELKERGPSVRDY